MNSMPLWFGGECRLIHGGPYFHRPARTFGVKLAPEITMPSDLFLPIADFSVPESASAKSACLVCIKALVRGEQIYVGCWGGRGRTGLFLALMAKIAGEADPVGYVRATYHPHAIETFGQEKFVEEFDVLWLRWAYQAASGEAAKNTAPRGRQPLR